MERWQHKRMVVHNEDIDRVLQEMGDIGWELVAVMEDTLDTYKQLYFKTSVTVLEN